MKPITYILFILLSINSLFSSGQSDLQRKVNRLKDITEMPYLCRDSIYSSGCGQFEFWDIVKEKDTAIPVLLNLLDDTTTTIATVPNFGGNWTVGDIAYSALEEIIKGIPTFELLGVPFESEGCGYCSYWNHLRSSFYNRKDFKHNVIKWYKKNKVKLVWIKSNEVMTCDCHFDHPNGGHYEIIQ